MTVNRPALILMGLMLTTAGAAAAQGAPERAGFWASVQLGYGALETSSDQEPRDRQGTLALGFNLGASLNRHVRVGAQLSGWLQEGSDIWNPEKGESVSQVLAIVLVYPWSTRGLFLKAGAGRAIYTDHDPDGFGSSGWGATLAAGYDWPVGARLSLTPVVLYARGTLGDVDNALVTIHDRRYHAFELGVALTYR